MTTDFFDEPLPQSIIKARIVSKYFKAWSQVMLHTPRQDPRIGFYDLFAGTGTYENGEKSTPLLVLETALQNPEIRDNLITIFNDKEESHCTRLRDSILKLPGIDGLKHKPSMLHLDVDSNVANLFKQQSLVPSILFLDPWGYKGLSLDLIRSVVKDWGSECIFFFNYRRVNAAFSNPTFNCHIDELFGSSRASHIRLGLHGKKPFERESFIMDQLSEALKESASFVLRFRFESPDIDRTSHYLIFVTKGFRGYEIMKDIMAGESVPSDSMVPTFEYTEHPEQNQLLNLNDPNEELAGRLLRHFKGRTLSFDDIYKEDSPDTPYVKDNYRKALFILENAHKVSVISTGSKKRRASTFGSSCAITFIDDPTA